MINKAIQTIQRCHLLSPGDTVIAACSGGADSVALTWFLNSIKEQYSLRLQAAHVNHGLRGEESDRDEAFVRDFCARLEIPLHVLHTNIRDEAKKAGEGLEACGRQVRYTYFTSLSGETGKIATAHTLNDNAETLLLHLARGAGLRGVSGMAERRGQIIRPLIHCTRSEIEAFCAEHQLDYVMDSTNSLPCYARNRVRLDAVPALCSVNPSFLQSVDRFMETVRGEDAFLERLAEEALSRARCVEENGLYTLKLSGLDPVLLHRVLRRYVLEQTGRTMEAEHVKALAGCLSEGARTQVGGGIRAHTYRGIFRLIPDTLEMNGKSSCYNQIIPDNVNRLVLTYEDFINIEEKRKKQFAFCADYDKISGDVILRARRAGDTLRPAGRQGSKSLKKLFQEAGIPQEQRVRYPVVCDALGVVGVWKLCTSQRVAVDAGTRRVFVLTE